MHVPDELILVIWTQLDREKLANNVQFLSFGSLLVQMDRLLLVQLRDDPSRGHTFSITWAFVGMDQFNNPNMHIFSCPNGGLELS